MRWINRLLELLSFKATPAPKAASTETQKTIDLISDYFETNGGLSGALKRFEATGYVSKVRSWVSAGPNRPINSIEAMQLIGRESLVGMAKKSGIPVDRLRDLLAELLPVAIDRATPDGRLPGGILAV